MHFDYHIVSARLHVVHGKFQLEFVMDLKSVEEGWRNGGNGEGKGEGMLMYAATSKRIHTCDEYMAQTEMNFKLSD